MTKLKEIAHLMEGIARKIRRDDFVLDELDLKWLDLRLEHCRQIVHEILTKPDIQRQNEVLAFAAPKRSLGLKRANGRQNARS